jgi:NADH dehydrogenase
LSLPNHPNIYVVGDLASAKSYLDPKHPTVVPGVSPGAKQMGRKAAKNIMRRMQGKDTGAFRYLDYGSLATIGKRAAIALVDVPFTSIKIKFSGLSAWLFWLFVHVYFLIGFRNRMVVFMDWAWAYFTSQRHARIFIIPQQMREPNAVPVANDPPPRQPPG